MSTVTRVPETYDLDADDVPESLSKASWSLFQKAFVRFRYADGFSFARSLAFQVVMTLVPGTIFVVALAAWIGEGRFQSTLRSMIESLAAGPAGDIFLSAFAQGAENGSSGNRIAVVAGGAAMLISAVTAMAQLQRGASRIYGIDSDRPTLLRYLTATVLTLSAGVLLTVAFLLIALGGSVGQSFEEGSRALFAIARWPVGIAALTLALAALFKYAPNRRQPGVIWLATGGTVAALAWVATSAGLALYLNASNTFGETYGPLAGIIGLALWAQLSAIAILYGVAVAAQLEGARAGIDEPLKDRQPRGTVNIDLSLEELRA